MGLWGATWSGPATPSGYASQLIPVFKYYSELLTIASTNNTIVFGEGGGALTATIASGDWTWGEVAWKVKVALEAAGAGTYTVTYSHATRKFTIAKSAGTFTLDVGGSANDALDDLGYTSDKSGALTYTSDISVPSQATLTCTSRIVQPDLDLETEREDLVVESGRKESVHHGDHERYVFRLEFESTATALGLVDMWRRAGRYGNEIDLYPDSADLTNFATGYWDTTRPAIRRSRIYRLWDVEFPFRFKQPAPAGSSTLKPRDFYDRRPTS